MGYNITIGERGDLDPETESYDVATVRRDDAPAFGEPTDFTNERWPSYSTWGDFLENTGLQWLSPTTNHAFRAHVRADCPPLMVEHPGLEPLREVHREAIEHAYVAYRQKIGMDKIAGWAGGEKYSHVTGRFEQVPTPANADQFDGNLARLEWLRYWVNWALDNCTNPVFKNT